MSSLDGRVAVVTGALGKLGPSLCAALAEAGATVAGLDLTDGDCEGAGCSVLVQADVTDRSSVEAAAARIAAEAGDAAVLVNCAGIDQPPTAGAGSARIEDLSAEDFGGTLAVNLVGAFVATQVFGAPMAERGVGSIVNIGSLYASTAPDPSLYEHMEPPFLKPPAYGASKAGLVNLTRYFARLWGPRGVRVNALSPGGVAGGQDAEFVRKYEARVPLGRMAEPADLGGPLVFLASDASRYVTGHELRVDGGFTA